MNIDILINHALKNNNINEFSNLFISYPKEISFSIPKYESDSRFLNLLYALDISTFAKALEYNPSLANYLCKDNDAFSNLVTNESTAHNFYKYINILKFTDQGDIEDNICLRYKGRKNNLSYDDIIAIYSKLDLSNQYVTTNLLKSNNVLSNNEKLEIFSNILDCNIYDSRFNDASDYCAELINKTQGINIPDEYLNYDLIRALSNSKIKQYFCDKYETELKMGQYDIFCHKVTEDIRKMSPASHFFYSEQENLNTSKTHKEYTKFISQIFGKEFGEIVDKRKGLVFNTTASFNIFDKDILNRYGEDFINMCLTYRFNGLPTFFNIQKNKNEVAIFDKFYKDLLKIYNKPEYAFDIATKYYYSFKDLYVSIGNTTLNKKQEQNLKLALLDIDLPVKLDSLNELEDYNTRRRDCILSKNEYGENSNNLKNFLQAFICPTENSIFGSQSRLYSLSTMLLNKNSNILEKLTEENNNYLNKEEKSLFTIINSINKIQQNMQNADEIICKLTDKFLQNNNTISPLDFTTLTEKLSSYCATNLKNILTDNSKLKEERFASSKRYGIKTYDLNKTDFTFLTHNFSLGYSNLGFTSKIDNIFDIFTTTENGISSISTKLINRDLIKNADSWSKDTRAFVFTNFEHNDIINMGIKDTYNSHKPMLPIPYSLQSSLSTPDYIINRTNLYSEIGISRRNKKQERIYPDALMLSKEITKNDIELVKKFNDFYEKNKIKNPDGSQKVMSIYDATKIKPNNKKIPNIITNAIEESNSVENQNTLTTQEEFEHKIHELNFDDMLEK